MNQSHSTNQTTPPEPTPHLLPGGLKSPATHENGSGLVVSVDTAWITFHPDKSPEIPDRYAFLHPVRAAGLLRWEAHRDLKDEVLQLASIMLQCHPGDWYPLGHGQNKYRQSLVGPGGSQLQFDARGGLYFTLVLPGKACQLAGPNFLKGFFVYALSTGAKFPRIDTAIDDWHKRIDPDRFLAECKGPDKVTHVKEARRMSKESLRGHPDDAGKTVYLGSAKSDRMLRVYDKDIESNGQIPAYRMELQERKKFADRAAMDLAYGEWPKVIPSRLVGFIDFKDHESAAHVDDRTRCQWFEELMDGARKGAAYDPVPPKDRQETVDYWERQHKRTLALWFHHYGGDLGKLAELAKEGREDWKPRHHSLANEDTGGIPNRPGQFMKEAQRFMKEAQDAYYREAQDAYERNRNEIPG